MQTRTGFTTAARAETLARLLHGKPDVGEGALERAERVAHAVGTDRRRAMVWVRQTLAYASVDRSNPAIYGHRKSGANFRRPETGVEFYFTASSERKAVWTLVRQLRGPHLSTWA